MTVSDSSASVVIVGAGQAGLSVAYYLRTMNLAPGRDFVIFDRGQGPGGAWQHRWESLRLGTAHRVNNLPGMPEMGISFDTADHSRPARDVVAEYYRRYEEHYGLAVVRPVAVTGVTDHGDRLVVSTSSDAYGDRTTSTRVLVNATGTWGAPFIPHYPGSETFRGRQVHTANYVSVDEFAGQRVIVVGGGTSAIGFLLELDGVAASLTWAARRPIDWVHSENLDLEGAVAAVAMQNEAARAGRALPSIVSGTGVPVTQRIQAGIDRGLLIARPMFASVEPEGVRWSDGTFSPADAIIWATGFRPELRHLSPLKLRAKAGGYSVEAGASAVDPRIFFAGYGPQASTIGANRAGRVIARQIAARLAEPAERPSA
ncbi:pyridine nucleotide-disulfide oxidoreductase [Cryobacterium sp. MLB-32]|uniref:NAD(P)-binding domain-containing protein n=1 Tax=Cryobacterium sp. MLB-32 TaxID=1529318 RepID=UPI0004E6061D|nr:NAD(P)-binding domain-containing protein [Cryobacterium sp. MLB-32]KFF58762.1 pyridine nucleotide-disulfide oxidoreductase [Cryobacterium sp. MLB-32]